MKPIDSIRAAAPVTLAAASATPDYSTQANPPSIHFSGHAHVLEIPGAALDAAAAKPAGSVTRFTVGGTHAHNFKLTTEQAQALIRDGMLQATADGGHTHAVTFKRQGSGSV